MKEHGRPQALVLKYCRIAITVMSIIFLAISILLFSLVIGGKLEGQIAVIGAWSIVSMTIILVMCLVITAAGKTYEKTMFKVADSRERLFSDNMDIIRALSANYNAVYYCDLLTGEVSFLQLSDRIQKYMGQEYSETHPLEWYAQAYSRKLVKKEYKEEFVKEVSTSNLRERLKDRDYYTYVYLGDKNGVDTYFEMKAAKINGSENRLVVGFADVDDEIREKEEQAKLTRDALTQANQSNLIRENLIESVSDTIKHPIDAIVEIAKLLVGNEDNPDSVKANGAHIMMETESMYAMLSDICEVNRIQNQKFMLNLEETNLAELLVKSVESLDILAEERGVDISISKQLVHSRVLCDAERVSGVVRHIIASAIDNSDRGSRIVATVFETQVLNGKAYYDFLIEDKGRKLSPEFVESLKSDETLEIAYEKDAKGMKFFNLSLAKVIVNLMGGKFEIVSSEENGTSINVLVSFDILD